ncbi:hypothetical protein QAD02_023931 [Eretmocerus hayati]|uniref:Uncharacterized protein n=1 Tax=Eretmocerus hayati TaxID=131215 RepID=A0ACC2PZD8_9HYME|nr:hypothetical protein QAD02_023931 [Eretmocerus hayati]
MMAQRSQYLASLKQQETGGADGKTPPASEDRCPVVPLQTSSLTNKNLSFLVDTGCSLNLIKSKYIDENVVVDKKVIYNLIGIGENTVKTLGKVTLNFDGTLIPFNIIPDNFPVESSVISILGLAIRVQREQLTYRQETSKSSIKN